MAAPPRRRSALVAQLTELSSGERLAGGSSDDILRLLRRAILAGVAAPGTPIQVDEVADAFLVSRIPVREALKTLIGEGLVDHRPRAGYTIAQLTAEEFQEIYLVRGVLERAALNAAVVGARDGDDTEPQQAHDALAVAIEQGDYRGYHRESRRFHLALLAPARMPRLLNMLEAAWNITEPCQPMAYVSDDARRRMHRDHQDMLVAFRSRDARALLSAADAHQQRLEASIADLPRDTGLFAVDDVPEPVEVPAQVVPLAAERTAR